MDEWANPDEIGYFLSAASWMLGRRWVCGSVEEWRCRSFIVIAQTMAGICAFALARPISAEERGAFWSGVLCGESVCAADRLHAQRFCGATACALMPLVLLTGAGTLWAGGKTAMARFRAAMALFAVAFAAVWLSNAPAGVLASYSVALILAVGCACSKILAAVVARRGGLALGFGLASFTFAAAYEQRWVNITQALSSGLQSSDNFLYTMGNDPEHNAFNWIASSTRF